MSRTWLRALLLSAVAVVSALAFAASTTRASTPASAPTSLGVAPTAGVQQIGNMSVTLKIKKFVKQGRKLVAVGTAVQQFQPTADNPAGLAPATVSKSFTAPVTTMRGFMSAQRICPVLSVTLGQLDLVLLGLHAHLDKVHLTITANSKGGVLGSLFCSLAHAKVSLAGKAKSLTKATSKSSLSTKGIRMAVPLYRQAPASAGGANSSTAAPLAICPILDLTLGPLDLDLLGLMVHLDVVHLTITADPTGGVLGSLLCGLAGGPGASVRAT